jgi:hypothetical protein
MTVVAEPDNRRKNSDRESDFCKGSHDASLRRFTALGVAPECDPGPYFWIIQQGVF